MNTLSVLRALRIVARRRRHLQAIIDGCPDPWEQVRMTVKERDALDTLGQLVSDWLRGQGVEEEEVLRSGAGLRFTQQTTTN